MQKFTTLTAVAAPLPLQNVDTDMIIPKQFLKTIRREGLSDGLFYEMRYDVQGNKIEDFVLHLEPHSGAKILVAGDNFGCGSSREHAPWALLDFGIRCVIAPSFADIFYNNCMKNGILPIRLPQEQVDMLIDSAASGQAHSVDLGAQTVTVGKECFTFEIDPHHKHCLLEGIDDIGQTLEKTDAIAAFEAGQRDVAPWLYG